MRTNGSAKTVWKIVKSAAKRYEMACHLKVENTKMLPRLLTPWRVVASALADESNQFRS